MIFYFFFAFGSGFSLLYITDRIRAANTRQYNNISRTARGSLGHTHQMCIRKYGGALFRTAHAHREWPMPC